MNHSLNLMTTRSHRKAVINSRLRQWAVVLAVVGLFAFLAETMLWRDCQRHARHLRQLEAEAAPLRAEQAVIERLERELGALRAQEQTTIALSSKHPPLACLGFVSQACATCEESLYVTRMGMVRRVPEKGTTENASAAPNAPYDVTLDGVGLDNAAVARFGDALQEIAAFRDVRASTLVAKAGEREACSFSIRCSL